MHFDHRDEHVDEGMLIVQTNLDDMNPETCGYVMDKLFEAGANDVFWIPVIMKKGRPGLMLNVLVAEQALDGVETVIFRETTTLGLRYTRAACHRLGRQFVKVSTPWGEIPIKVGLHQGQAVQFAPEYADCEAAARRHQVPLKRVYEEARRRYMEQFDKGWESGAGE